MKFSVIMPVYNSVDYLRETVESITRQGYEQYELLLVDDGSSDGSEVLCDQLSSEDPHVICFHIPNGGIAHARNHALRHASGEYIMFCDNDDGYRRGIFDALSQAIDEEDESPDCVCFGRMLMQLDAEGAVQIQTIAAPAQKTYLRNQEIAENYHLFTYSDCVWCRAYKRSFLEAENLSFDDSLRRGGDDILFNAQVASAARGILYLPDVFYVWMRRANHSTSMGITADVAQGISLGLKEEISFLMKGDYAKNNPSVFGMDLLRQMVFQIVGVRYKQSPSLQDERVLYEQLHEIYRPYVDVIDAQALPFSYRIEYLLLINKHYRILYHTLRLTGIARRVQRSIC